MLLLAGAAQADESPIGLCDGGIHLVYANGMYNSREIAGDSLKALKAALATAVENNDSIHWNPQDSHVAYNFNEGLIDQLLEVYEQKMHEKMRTGDNRLDDYIDFWTWYFDLNKAPDWYQDTYINAFQQLGKVAIGKRVVNFFKAQKKRIAAIGAKRAKKRRALTDSIMQDHGYRTLLLQKRKFLTVAHSQGNLFSNDAFERLAVDHDLRGKAALLSVATPASYVYGDGSYLTLESDGVINLARRAAPVLGLTPALPANTKNSIPQPGRFDHDFEKHYLHGQSTGERLIESATHELEALSEEDHRQKRPYIDEKCSEWWSKIKGIDRKNSERCLLDCATAPISLATFDCNMHCEYWCRCDLGPWPFLSP